MIIKYNYKNEVISKAWTIITLLLSAIMLIGGVLGLKQLMDEETSIGVLIIFELLFLGIPSVFIYKNHKDIHNAKLNRKKAKEIIENGIKVQGKIIDTRMERVDVASATEKPRYCYYYHLIVEYTNNMEIYTIESPRVNFHPDYLISKDVDVYLYENGFYIDNFKLDLNEMEKNKNKTIKMNLIVILLFILLVIINAIFIFLGINKVISSELAMNLCMISLVISAIVGVTLCIIKGIKDMIKISKETNKNK